MQAVNGPNVRKNLVSIKQLEQDARSDNRGGGLVNSRSIRPQAVSRLDITGQTIAN